MNVTPNISDYVARNVADIRKHRGLTLEQLAVRASVSKGMIIQIEQGKTNASVATLARLANALGVTVARLVEVEDRPHVRIVERSEGVKLWNTDLGSLATLLMGVDGRELVELWEWRIEPGEFFDGGPHIDGARELLFVQKGELSLKVDMDWHKVKSGQIVQFSGDRPHRYANETKRPVSFIMVTIEPAIERPRRKGKAR